MLESFVNIMREYPTLAIFLTVGVGFLVGRLRIGSFSLGSVTAVLLTGVVVGQLDIPVTGPLKMFFFMMFLFSIGYSVGPDFFRSLRGQGARQALFAVIMSAVCMASTLLIAKLMHYSKGEAIGLFSGSQTCSALLGVGSEALGRLGLPADELKSQMNIIPVCYAVTYIFGTLGTVLLLGNFGPKLLGGLHKVKAQTAELEKSLNNAAREQDPATINALRAVAYRTYVVDNDFFATPQTVRATEKYLRGVGLEVYIDRVLHDEEIYAPRHDDHIFAGDRIVVCGRREFMVDVEAHIGRETADTQLLSYPLARVGVLVTKRQFCGRTISELRQQRYMHGIVIRDAARKGHAIDIDTTTTFERGDRLTIL